MLVRTILGLLNIEQNFVNDSNSYIPCLRVALAEVSWDRFCVPRAQRGGHRSSRRRLQQCHPQTRDVMILSSCFHLGNVLCQETLHFVCEDWQELRLLTFIQIFPPFFSEDDTGFRGWHKILCQPRAYYKRTWYHYITLHRMIIDHVDLTLLSKLNAILKSMVWCPVFRSPGGSLDHNLIQNVTFWFRIDICDSILLVSWPIKVL